MPKVHIHNRTKKEETLLPNGVALEIRTDSQTSTLAVGKTRTYEVSARQVIKIEPRATMIRKTSWVSDGTTRDLYIVPDGLDYGVAISYDNPDPDVEISYDDPGDGECRIL